MHFSTNEHVQCCTCNPTNSRKASQYRQYCTLPKQRMTKSSLPRICHTHTHIYTQVHILQQNNTKGYIHANIHFTTRTLPRIFNIYMHKKHISYTKSHKHTMLYIYTRYKYSTPSLRTYLISRNNFIKTQAMKGISCKRSNIMTLFF